MIKQYFGNFIVQSIAVPSFLYEMKQQYPEETQIEELIRHQYTYIVNDILVCVYSPRHPATPNRDHKSQSQIASEDINKIQSCYTVCISQCPLTYHRCPVLISKAKHLFEIILE